MTKATINDLKDFQDDLIEAAKQKHCQAAKPESKAAASGSAMQQQEKELAAAVEAGQRTSTPSQRVAMAVA